MGPPLPLPIRIPLPDQSVLDQMTADGIKVHVQPDKAYASYELPEGWKMVNSSSQADLPVFFIIDEKQLQHYLISGVWKVDTELKIALSICAVDPEPWQPPEKPALPPVQPDAPSTSESAATSPAKEAAPAPAKEAAPAPAKEAAPAPAKEAAPANEAKRRVMQFCQEMGPEWEFCQELGQAWDERTVLLTTQAVQGALAEGLESMFKNLSQDDFESFHPLECRFSDKRLYASMSLEQQHAVGRAMDSIQADWSHEASIVMQNASWVLRFTS